MTLCGWFEETRFDGCYSYWPWVSHLVIETLYSVNMTVFISFWELNLFTLYPTQMDSWPAFYLAWMHFQHFITLHVWFCPMSAWPWSLYSSHPCPRCVILTSFVIYWSCSSWFLQIGLCLTLLVLLWTSSLTSGQKWNRLFA